MPNLISLPKTQALRTQFQPSIEQLKRLEIAQGYYRLMDGEQQFDHHGNTYWKVLLSDFSGSYWVYWFNQSNRLESFVTTGAVFYLKLSSSQGRWRLLHKIELACRVSEQACLNPLPLLLPHINSYQPSLLKRALALYEQISSLHLRAFLNICLFASDVGPRLMICPASVSHHHAYPGGLFEHSVEVAEKLAQLVPSPNAVSKDLAIVLGLIHDIGKVKTIEPNHQHGSLGKRVQHDALTLEVCSAGLSYLDAHLPQIAIEIRHCLTCSTPNSRYGFKPQTVHALALQIADRESARHIC